MKTIRIVNRSSEIESTFSDEHELVNRIGYMEADMEMSKDNKLLNPDGFLAEMSGWSRELAQELSDKNEIGPLTDDHWRVIDFVREYYKIYGEGPAIVKIGKETGFDPSYICNMFPCGIARGAYRLAGLPRPAGCL